MQPLIRNNLAPLGLLLLALNAQHSLAQAPEAEWTTQQDHQNMLDQLGITALRPGPSGTADAPNAANTDEALANPYPDYPALLSLKNGQAVSSAKQWQEQRRGEIAEDFAREVIGRVPDKIPALSWSVVAEAAADTKVGDYSVWAQQLVGHVDNSTFPQITVDIQMTVVLPASVQGPVPVLMMFGRSILPGAHVPPPAFQSRFNFTVPPSTEQLLAAGWGYALLDPGSIQADNGAGLTKGIIGLANKGQARKPDDWGALRAWAWGAARGFDYLETLPAVDSTRVGIEGVSRYGKAALVTHAVEPRFSIALIGSSGEGGVAPYRRNFGEAVESLTGSGEYHWMAGNFLKYGTAESAFGNCGSFCSV